MNVSFRVNLKASIFLVLAMLCASWVGGWGTMSVRAQSSRLTPLEAVPADAQQVFVGVHPVSVYAMDVQAKTFCMDFYTWFRWQGALDPMPALIFANAIEPGKLMITPEFDEARQYTDGSRYQRLRVDGCFAQPFDLTRFPFDHQQLTIHMENKQYPLNQLVYVADKENIGFSALLDLPSWKISEWKLRSQVHKYNTTFGDAAGNVEGTQYSAIRYSLEIDRPLAYSLFKFLLPLLVILAINWLTLLIDARYAVVRLAVPVATLIVLALAQLSYVGTLGSDSLVLLDKIYALAYLSILATIAYAIFTTGWLSQTAASVEEPGGRGDRRTLGVLVTVFVVGALLFAVFS